MDSLVQIHHSNALLFNNLPENDMNMIIKYTFHVIILLDKVPFLKATGISSSGMTASLALKNMSRALEG